MVWERLSPSEMNNDCSIYAVRHQIEAIWLRLIFFGRLHLEGVKEFTSCDVEEDVDCLFGQWKHLKRLRQPVTR